MSHRTTFTCDQCGQPIGEPYGPLIVTMSAPEDDSIDREQHFCTFDCFCAWAQGFANRVHWGDWKS